MLNLSRLNLRPKSILKNKILQLTQMSRMKSIALKNSSKKKRKNKIRCLKKNKMLSLGNF